MKDYQNFVHVLWDAAGRECQRDQCQVVALLASGKPLYDEGPRKSLEPLQVCTFGQTGQLLSNRNKAIGPLSHGGDIGEVILCLNG